MPNAGNGTRAVFKQAISVAEVKCSMVERNEELINSLKVNDHSNILMDLTLKDAELGRMSMPVPCTSEHIQSFNISRRFGVEQGAKVRACDDETASKVNAGCEPSERLRVDGLDALLAAITLFFTCAGCVLSLLKADIDSAYRRVPIKPSDRWAAFVAFAADFQGARTSFVSGHYAMPFGAVGSVHSWDRIGALLVHIIRWQLRIPIALVGRESAGRPARDI